MESRVPVELSLSWVGVEEKPVMAANHFISQFAGGGFYVTFGIAVPPVLLGTPEEKREQAMKIPFVPVEALSRIALTRQGMEELIDVLQRNLEHFEEAENRAQGSKED